MIRELFGMKAKNVLASDGRFLLIWSRMVIVVTSLSAVAVSEVNRELSRLGNLGNIGRDLIWRRV